MIAATTFTPDQIYEITQLHISVFQLHQHEAMLQDTLLMLQLQTECFTLKIVVYFKS